MDRRKKRDKEKKVEGLIKKQKGLYDYEGELWDSSASSGATITGKRGRKPALKNKESSEVVHKP